MRRSWILSLALVACSGRDSTPAAPAPAPEAPPPVAPEPARPADAAVPAAPAASLIRPLPSGGRAQPTTIRLVNRTGDPIELDTTWGQLAFLAASTPNGDLGPLSLDASDHFCDCVCRAGGRCPECERPRDARMTIAARGTRELAWNGRLRRVGSSATESRCQEVFDPEAGPLLVGACTADGRSCAVAEVTLPAALPIELAFPATPPRAASCPLEPALAERAFRIATFTMDLGAVVPDRRQPCRMDASRCVMPEAIELARGGERRQPCATFLMPRREGIEVETFLPLPPGTNGGETYSVSLDPNTLRVTRLRYEQ